MAMQPRALVTVRNVREAMGRLDLEYAKYIHGRIVPPGRKFGKRSATAAETDFLV
jgi:hypothetical protein